VRATRQQGAAEATRPTRAPPALPRHDLLNQDPTDSDPEKPSPPPSLVQALAPGDVLRARYSYRLTRRLGAGAFGSVFLAECLEASARADEPGEVSGTPPAQVAIKVLETNGDDAASSSLKRELSALLAIQAPRIPVLYDWSLERDIAFSVTQYFPCGSLADLRNTTGQLDEEQTWRLISDLLAALNAAHRASILHLDIKPSNVLLDGEGGYVLTDFGVSQASRMSRGLLQQGRFAVALGTHGYRAPEQANREVQAFDLRTDLWGVGATAWALYTGIDLNRRTDVLRRRADGNVFGLQRLSDVHLACSSPLEEVIMGLLYIDPSRRPGGAAEVLAQISSAASGFGLASETVVAARRNCAEPDQVQSVIEALVDPLWAAICRTPGFERYFAKFEDGEVLSSSGEASPYTFLLLRGAVAIEGPAEGGPSDDDEPADANHEPHEPIIERREGILMGAISTLTGVPRKTTLRARGDVWTCIFNEAELEKLVACNPSVAVRMIRSIANRVVEGPDRASD